jgi:hypothetical protein
MWYTLEIESTKYVRRVSDLSESVLRTLGVGPVISGVRMYAHTRLIFSPYTHNTLTPVKLTHR